MSMSWRDVWPAVTAFASAGALTACSMLLDTSALMSSPPDAAAGDGGGEADASAEAGASVYRDVVLADSPAAYFRLNEIAAPVRSEVGSFTGAAVGSPDFGVPGAIGGEADRAFAPAGRGGLDLGQVFDFVGTTPFSIELWTSVSAIDDAFRFFFAKSSGTGAAREAYGAYVITGAEGQQLVFERFVGGQSRIVVVPPPSLGTYHHLVTIFDGSALSVWMDGSQRGATPDTRPAGAKATALLVGTPTVDADLKPLLGSVDELAIYTHALSADRVMAHFRAGHPQ